MVTFVSVHRSILEIQPRAQGVYLRAGKGLGSSLHPRGWIHLSCLTTSIFILSSGQTPAARCWLLRNQPEHLLVPPTPRDALLPFPCAPHTRAGRGDALRSRRGGRESPIPAIRCRQRQNGRLLLRALRLSETLTETKESPLGELSPSAWNRARALAAGGEREVCIHFKAQPKYKVLFVNAREKDVEQAEEEEEEQGKDASIQKSLA